MTGVYTENQPDFTWLKPFEEKSFKQYFMPYKKVGAVKNATIHAALGVEQEETGVRVTVYATELYEHAQIVVTNAGKEVCRKMVKLSPVDIFEESIEVSLEKIQDLGVSVYSNGKLLVAYRPVEDQIPELGQPAEAAKQPEEIMTNEELLLTAQHIEQHRHATYLPDPYYLEGLKRDPGDSRINQAYGMLLLRRGNFEEAERYFRAAIKRLTWRSPNPYNSEAYYDLGLALFYQKRFDEAYDAFYKAAWSSEQQEMSYYYLALIACGKEEYESALELVEKGLIKNTHNIRARGLKAVILRKLGAVEQAKAWITENLSVDPFDYVSMFESAILAGGVYENGKLRFTTEAEEVLSAMNGCMRDFHESYLQTARDYADAKCFAEAIAVLAQCTKKQPMLGYYTGYYLEQLGQKEAAVEAYREAEQASPLYCFPNKLEDIAVLQAAIAVNENGAKAYYYLGNLYYDKLQFDCAVELWEKSVALDDSYPTAHRNLSIAYYNKKNDLKAATAQMEHAFVLDQTDTRVFLELDQLYKKSGTSFELRLRNFEEHMDIIAERDDAMLELVTLYNLVGNYQKAYDTIMAHQFRPWEGAEGRLSGQYKIALTQMAKAAITAEDYALAERLLTQALEYPLNLGEGRLEGTKDNNIYYYLGKVKHALGKPEESEKCMVLAQMGEDEPAGAMYYYDQPADMILYKGLAKLEACDKKGAYACFNKLMDYGERHLYDQMKNDFFAVSLPDFLILDDDMNQKNKAHCHYLMGLANLGFADHAEAKKQFEQALTYDYNHQNCRIYLKMCVG